MIGIFSKEEESIYTVYFQDYKKEVQIFLDLLNSYSSTIEENEIKYEKETKSRRSIVLLLSHNISLLDNAFKLLLLGYLRSSEILMRTVSESIILATYFTEFPETEEEYKSSSHQDFFHKHKIDKMLKEVHNKGTIFVKNKNKPFNLHKNIYKYLYKEASRFSHNNLDLLNNLALTDSKKPLEFILGPKVDNKDIFLTELQRLIFATLSTYITFCISLEIKDIGNDKLLSIDIASKFLNK